ncbi:hypothetical protein DF133_29815 [Burkholderia cenocepacia]|nr:hypothetical protein DF133_29815 [Burkholderia cenocepacia]
MDERADLDKKYTAEIHARLVKLVGTVKAKRFSRKGVTRKALLRRKARMGDGGTEYAGGLSEAKGEVYFL